MGCGATHLPEELFQTNFAVNRCLPLTHFYMFFFYISFSFAYVKDKRLQFAAMLQLQFILGPSPWEMTKKTGP